MICVSGSVFYHASIFICTPASLSQEVGSLAGASEEF
ncbi:hypothetical protein J2W51_004673 [Tardiphaga robiniae]|nr:hypothetical protein [Tardiphaga robiniae]